MFCLSKFFLSTMLTRPVDADGVVQSRNEEEQSYIGIGVDVLVGLEQFVAGYVREEQAVFVQHPDESGLTSLGRGVAVTRGVAGGHHGEGGEFDEFLHELGHIGFYLGSRSALGIAKSIAETVGDDAFLGSGHRDSWDARLSSFYPPRNETARAVATPVEPFHSLKKSPLTLGEGVSDLETVADAKGFKSLAQANSVTASASRRQSGKERIPTRMYSGKPKEAQSRTHRPSFISLPRQEAPSPTRTSRKLAEDGGTVKPVLVSRAARYSLASATARRTRGRYSASARAATSGGLSQSVDAPVRLEQGQPRGYLLGGQDIAQPEGRQPVVFGHGT